jgi:hypothetical protein
VQGWLRRLATVAERLRAREKDESSCKKDVTSAPDDGADEAERTSVGEPAGGEPAGGGAAVDEAGRSRDDRGRG